MVGSEWKRVYVLSLGDCSESTLDFAEVCGVRNLEKLIEALAIYDRGYGVPIGRSSSISTRQDT